MLKKCKGIQEHTLTQGNKLKACQNEGEPNTAEVGEVIKYAIRVISVLALGG